MRIPQWFESLLDGNMTTVNNTILCNHWFLTWHLILKQYYIGYWVGTPDMNNIYWVQVKSCEKEFSFEYTAAQGRGQNFDIFKHLYSNSHVILQF